MARVTAKTTSNDMASIILSRMIVPTSFSAGIFHTVPVK
jgi:hypothetical protein